MAKSTMLALALAALLCASPRSASAARVLLVGGGNANDPSYDPRNAHPSEVSGPITRYTVPGTDVFVVDTTNAKVGNTGGVLANTIESNVRNGDTHDLLGTVARTRVTANARPDLRTVLGSNDQQAIVQSSVGKESAFAATRAAHGNAVTVNRGAGTSIRAPENRALVASQDASSAVQLAAGGVGANAGHATRVGSASAAAVQVNDSYFFTLVPTWWRR